MPTLEWIGKSKVINHHQEVPYRVLERRYSFDADGQHDEDNGSKNMIIRGDNLQALKALLPRYEGRIKCIYIDPPYNTGEEHWSYNDNVNDPKIKKWLGEVVGKEGEDLSRHDKWLCMMYPRLKLLQKLLADDGVIFISISDVECFSLKFICDEIFGSSCFCANITWQNNFSPRNDAKGIPYETDNILVYSKLPGWQPQKLGRNSVMDSRFVSPDNDPIPWTSSPAHAPGASTHKGMVYGIQHPYTGKIFYPPAGRHWAFEQAKMLANMNLWSKYKLESIEDIAIRARICGEHDLSTMPYVEAIVLDESIEESKRNVLKRIAEGSWPVFYFTNNGQGGLRIKKYLNNMNGKTVTTLWPYTDVGSNTEAKNELKKIFDGVPPLETPKPVRLIERVLQIAGSQDTLILDSFAGSGTTAHAVLNMNKADGGHRKFIMVEMEKYADYITAERVKRVIRGYGEGKNTVEGTGGDFSFYDLGEPLLIGDCLNEAVGTEKIREYVWFMETKRPYTPAKGSSPYYLGAVNSTAYYFYYEPQKVTVLDYDFLATVPERAESAVIYADRCSIGADKLVEMGIVFKKIPRDISRL